MTDFLHSFITGPFWSAIEYLTGWVFTDPVKRTLEWASLLGGATIACWSGVARLLGRKTGIENSIEALRDELERVRTALEETTLAEAAANRYGDAIAGIETVKGAGRAEALSDSSGAAAEAVLDALIAEREKARQQTAKEDAALYRQKGALAALYDPAASLASYERAVVLDPVDSNGWSGLLLAADAVGNEHLSQGSYDEAELAFLRVGEAATRLGNPDFEAYAAGNLGRLEYERRNFHEAELLFRRMQAITSERGTKELEVGAAAYLEEIYRAQDKLLLCQLMAERKNELILELEGAKSEKVPLH